MAQPLGAVMIQLHMRMPSLKQSQLPSTHLASQLSTPFPDRNVHSTGELVPVDAAVVIESMPMELPGVHPTMPVPVVAKEEEKLAETIAVALPNVALASTTLPLPPAPPVPTATISVWHAPVKHSAPTKAGTTLTTIQTFCLANNVIVCSLSWHGRPRVVDSLFE